jgi:hypothetical protein
MVGELLWKSSGGMATFLPSNRTASCEIGVAVVEKCPIVVQASKIPHLHLKLSANLTRAHTDNRALWHNALSLRTYG